MCFLDDKLPVIWLLVFSSLWAWQESSTTIYYGHREIMFNEKFDAIADFFSQERFYQNVISNSRTMINNNNK